MEVNLANPITNAHNNTVDNNNNNTLTIEHIPDEILLNIMSYLKPSELVHQVSLLSKHLRVLSSDNSLWENFLKNRFPNSYAEYMETNGKAAAHNSYNLYTRTSLFWSRILKNPDCKTMVAEDPMHNITRVMGGVVFFNRRAFAGSNHGSIQVFNLDTCNYEDTWATPQSTTSQLIIHENKIICGSYDSTISVWDATTEKPLYKLEGHTGKIRSLKVCKIASNIFHLVSLAKHDSKIKFWDLENGKFLKEYQIVEEMRCFDVIKDTLAVGNDDGEIFILREGFEMKKISHHSHEVTQIQIHKDYVISSSYDKTIKVCQLVTGELLSSFDGHSAEIDGFKFVNDTLLSYSTDKTVRIWRDLTNPDNVSQLEGHTSSITDVEVFDNKIITLSVDKTLNIWDFETNQLLKTITVSDDERIFTDFVRVRQHQIIVSAMKALMIYS